MRNLKLEIEYDGTHYCGWQVQGRNKHKISIQETLKKALQLILQEEVRIIGSGRTDAGVHALGQVANFKTSSRLSIENIQKSLNSLLPPDIVIKKITEVPADFHSRYSAKSKTYRYFILNSTAPSVFFYKFSWHIPYCLNVKRMQDEAGVLLGRHDFKSFCASGSSVKNTVRTIRRISIKKMQYGILTEKCKLIVIDIEADGFLYNMARNIVGTLVETGRGRFKRGVLKKILLVRDRRQAGPTASANGLFLVKVKY